MSLAKASAQSRTADMIRSARDFLLEPTSPVPGSPAGSEDVRAPSSISTVSEDDDSPITSSQENPREIRNKAEKQRRDKLNHSISELAAMVPPIVAANKKIDKTGVLRLTAHYLRSHQYVFGDSIGKPCPEITPATAQLLLSLLGGFLLTTTYRGLVVVVSQNVQQYLGHIELDLLGQNIFNYIHPDDYQTLKDNLMPRTQSLGPSGELLIPDEPDGKRKIAEALANEKRRFLIRFKKHSQRSEPVTYVPCYVEGTLRKSDKACRVTYRCGQMVRRARARYDNPCSSGNDIVFIGVVRPAANTFITEQRMEAYRMEYRTRHSVDGEIMECEHRISLVAGYMTHEVNGINAMNFIHRDDVRWVIFSLRDMYDQHRVMGESCYRLMTKNGQFIYMWTRGSLDVDEDTRAVRSFVCTNTVVGEEEGKHLIKMMKKRCMMMISTQKLFSPAAEELKQIPASSSAGEVTGDQTLPVPDLEKIILHLVTDLPSSAQKADSRGNSPDRGESSLPLAIIPPRKEKIVRAIEKIYGVIKAVTRKGTKENMEKQQLKVDDGSAPSSPARSPVRTRLEERARQNLILRRQLEGRSVPDSYYFEASSVTPMRTVTPNFTLQGGASANTYQQEMGQALAGQCLIDVSPINECADQHTTRSSNVNSRKRGQPSTGINLKKPNNGVYSEKSGSEATPSAANAPALILLDELFPPPDDFADIVDDSGNAAAAANLDNIEPSINFPWDSSEEN